MEDHQEYTAAITKEKKRKYKKIKTYYNNALTKLKKERTLQKFYSSLPEAEEHLFPTVKFSQDLFKCLIQKIDMDAHIEIIYVSKAWHDITIPFLQTTFFRRSKFYGDEFEKTYELWTYLRKPLFYPFNKISQTKIFHNFMMDVFKEEMGNSITLFQYIQQSAARFSQDSHANKSQLLAQAYINSELDQCSKHINFLFNSRNLYYFDVLLRINNQNSAEFLNPIGCSFVLDYLKIIKKITSFLTTLILFNKIERCDNDWNPLKNQEWTRFLMGKDLVALDSLKPAMHLINRLIKICIQGKDDILTLQKARELLSKLNPSDLLNLLDASDTFDKDQLFTAIKIRQPEILALMFRKDTAKNKVLICLLCHNKNAFFELLDCIPEIKKHIETSDFISQVRISHISDCIVEEIIDHLRESYSTGSLNHLVDASKNKKKTIIIWSRISLTVFFIALGLSLCLLGIGYAFHFPLAVDIVTFLFNTTIPESVLIIVGSLITVFSYFIMEGLFQIFLEAFRYGSPFSCCLEDNSCEPIEKLLAESYQTLQEKLVPNKTPTPCVFASLERQIKRNTEKQEEQQIQTFGF